MNSMYSRREEANKEVMSMVGSMMAAMQANKDAIFRSCLTSYLLLSDLFYASERIKINRYGD